MSNPREYIKVGGSGGAGGAGGILEYQVPGQPEQTFTDGLNSRISSLIDLVGDTRSVLSETGDRLLGSLPRGVSGENPAKPNGLGAEILARLDSVIACAGDALDEARRLQNGI